MDWPELTKTQGQQEINKHIGRPETLVRNNNKNEVKKKMAS